MRQLDLFHLIPIDLVSRWPVLSVHSYATAGAATGFLRDLLDRFPFPIHAVQVDGNPESMAGFEETCLQLGIRSFVEPTLSPKLNVRVEGLDGTSRREFWSATTEKSACQARNQNSALGRTSTIAAGITR